MEWITAALKTTVILNLQDSKGINNLKLGESVHLD